MSDRPLLTVAVPAYRRADLLRRCLESLRPERATTSTTLDIVVSDNSPAHERDVEALVRSFATTWPGPLRYFANPGGTGAVGNFNLCIERAHGQYTLILHDDDYLLPGAIDSMVDRLRSADVDRDRVVLFGVRVEDLEGRTLRRQEFGDDVLHSPAAAYRRLLGNSSFVRVPGLVVRTDTYREIGGFRVDAYTTCDFDMAVRLFGQHGVRCVPVTTSVYSVHAGSVTTTVFNPRTIELNWRAFEHARSVGVLEERAINALQARWYHQFILAGTWRALRSGDRSAARRVLTLFELPRIRSLGWSAKWAPVRVAFWLATRGAPRHPSERAATPSESSIAVDTADETVAPDW